MRSKPDLQVCAKYSRVAAMPPRSKVCHLPSAGMGEQQAGKRSRKRALSTGVWHAPQGKLCSEDEQRGEELDR